MEDEGLWNQGDWEGEFTYVGARGSSVINYVLVNENICNRVSGFRIGDRVDLNHIPLELERRRRRGQEKESQE